MSENKEFIKVNVELDNDFIEEIEKRGLDVSEVIRKFIDIKILEEKIKECQKEKELLEADLKQVFNKKVI